jgi:hypothetical protein
VDTVADLESIPRPPGRLFLGNLFDRDASRRIESLMALARKCRPIFQIEVLGRGSSTGNSDQERLPFTLNEVAVMF